MIVYCGSCSAQNFVSPERLAIRERPPRCWECGRELPPPGGEAAADGETDPKPAESNGGAE